MAWVKNRVLLVLFGAGGPLAAVTAQQLAPAYRLRLTDLRPLATIAAEGKPQSKGAPLPAVLPPYRPGFTSVRCGSVPSSGTSTWNQYGMRRVAPPRVRTMKP